MTAMNNHKKIVSFLLPVLCTFVIHIKAQNGHSGMSPDKPAIHGMLIFGTQTIYASHLPLFHAPHNYQVILELELDKAAKEKFIKDQQLHPEYTTYTFEPESFILADKINSKGSFKANLYRGHFERGGVKIADSISIKIAAVIFFKQFDPAEPRRANAAYFLFGNGKEQFAVHQISNKPDFEQIIQVKTTALSNKTEPVVFSAINSPVGVSSNAITVKISSKAQPLILLKQLYLEFDDLKE
jgi:hypothetical protein